MLSALTTAATAAMPCDENGLCKYGGVCGEDGMCACAFDCANELWGKELYCGSELVSDSNRTGLKLRFGKF